MIARSIYYTLRRMLRSYLGYVYLMVIPLAIITVNGMAFGSGYVSEQGRTGMDIIAVGIIIGFQLVGGFYTMETMKGDLFSPLRWRLHALPYPPYAHAFSVLIGSAIFGVLNGLTMVLFTQWVYGVDWGSIAWVVLVLLLVSVVSQLVFMLAVLGIRTYKLAELVGYAYVFGFLMLAGYFFVTIPDTGVFQIVNGYLNPLALGETAIVNRLLGVETERAWISVGLLLAEAAVLSLLVIAVGRRRLA